MGISVTQFDSAVLACGLCVTPINSAAVNPPAITSAYPVTTIGCAYAVLSCDLHHPLRVILCIEVRLERGEEISADTISTAAILFNVGDKEVQAKAGLRMGTGVRQDILLQVI
jgi:hypothetical protein